MLCLHKHPSCRICRDNYAVDADGHTAARMLTSIVYPDPNPDSTAQANVQSALVPESLHCPCTTIYHFHFPALEDSADKRSIPGIMMDTEEEDLFRHRLDMRSTAEGSRSRPAGIFHQRREL